MYLYLSYFLDKKLATILKFKITIKTATSNIFSDFIAILDMGIAPGGGGGHSTFFREGCAARISEVWGLRTDVCL